MNSSTQAKTKVVSYAFELHDPKDVGQSLILSVYAKPLDLAPAKMPVERTLV